MRLQGAAGRILDQLLTALKAKATPRFHAAAAARRDKLAALRETRKAQAAKLAADKGQSGAINPHYLMAELAKVLDDHDIIFNEAVTNTGAVLLQIPRPQPNTAFNTNGAGLGWSGGMALGAKLAAPERMMVQICGDGGFYFNNPCSIFAVSQQYHVPIFSIVLDNSGWSAVKQSTLRVFPHGEANATDEFESKLAPKVDFTKVAEAFGAYAETLSRPKRRAGRDRALRQGSPRRPHRVPARARDAALNRASSFRGRAKARSPESITPALGVWIPVSPRCGDPE